MVVDMTKYDKILVVSVLLISVISIFYISNSTVNYNENYVDIYVDGKIYKKYTLDEIINEVIVLETEYGKNVIEIKNNSVNMIESTCSDKICTKQKPINKAGELIVCLPNRVVVEISGTKLENKIDTISY